MGDVVRMMPCSVMRRRTFRARVLEWSLPQPQTENDKQDDQAGEERTSKRDVIGRI